MIGLTIHDRAAEVLGIEDAAVDAFFRSCIKAHERLLADQLGPIRKNSPESAVTLVDVPGFPRVCVKEIRWRGWLHGVKGLLRPTQGRRSYRNGWRLLDAGISAAAPLGLFRLTRWGVVQAEWMIMEVMPSALELDRYVLREASRAWTHRERRAFARAFGRFIGELHAKGMVHSDLKTCNILVSRGPGAANDDADAPRFTLLDYDDVRFFSRVPFRKRIKNLVQIFLSTPLVLGISDRMRFLTAYAAETGLDRREARELAVEVLAAARGRTILYVGFDGDVVEQWE